MFHCTPLVIPPESLLTREYARPAELRDAAYEQAYDASTLFYNVVAGDDEGGTSLVFVGPPLLNLLPPFCRARIGGRPIASTVSRYYLRDRCCDVWLPWGNNGALQLETEFGSWSIAPQPAAHHLYDGKRVLYTLSKNNEPEWIIDWVQFHVRNHGANAVLIYDNASEKYTGADLELCLRKALPDLEINVVNWPYKFGPQGLARSDGWDSDFCQTGAFQDARFRFLDRAASVLNCDIDELVVAETGESIFETTERSGAGCILFRGSWIANAVADGRVAGDSPNVRHSHFKYLERASCNRCPTKWCAVPRKCSLDEQWNTHTVIGKDFKSSYSGVFSYRHFRGISTSWKYKRHSPTTFDAGMHLLDEELERSFVRAGMAAPGAKTPGSLAAIFRLIMGSSWREIGARPAHGQSAAPKPPVPVVAGDAQRPVTPQQAA